MANLFKKTITTTDLNYLKSIFDGLNATIITNTNISGNYLYLTIDNTITINFCKYSTSYFRPITLTYNGTTTSEIVRTDVTNNGLRITILYSTTLFYMQLQDNGNRRGAFLYEKIDENTLYGYKGSVNSSASFYDISVIELNEIPSGNIYGHKKVMTQSTSPEYIFYLSSDVLFIGVEKGYVNYEFRACSTIVVDQVITFENKNYYSIGTNTLVPIDN